MKKSEDLDASFATRALEKLIILRTTLRLCMKKLEDLNASFATRALEKLSILRTTSGQFMKRSVTGNVLIVTLRQVQTTTFNVI